MAEAAGYVRVSTEKQRENESHKNQRERLNMWGRENGHELTIYEDIAISGQSDERDAYERLMDEYTEYDMIVVRELSRFGRDLQNVLSDIQEINEDDVDFVSLKEDMIDTTSAQGQLFLQIIGAFNEFWANIARERAKEMVQRKREKGEKLGAPKKFDKDKREQIREWKDSGMSYGQIQLLIENGVEPFEQGTEVSRSTLYNYVKEN
jgi:DNA invertase Pin-like site-specific DNA recombinase